MVLAQRAASTIHARYKGSDRDGIESDAVLLLWKCYQAYDPSVGTSFEQYYNSIAYRRLQGSDGIPEGIRNTRAVIESLETETGETTQAAEAGALASKQANLATKEAQGEAENRFQALLDQISNPVDRAVLQAHLTESFKKISDRFGLSLPETIRAFHNAKLAMREIGETGVDPMRVVADRIEHLRKRGVGTPERRKALDVLECWLASDQNITQTARRMGMTRQVVTKLVTLGRTMVGLG